MSLSLQEAYDSEAMTSDMSEAWNHPSEVLTQQTENINQALQPAADLALEVYGQAEAKATEILDNLNDLYEDNAFHSQDIGNYVVQQTAEVQYVGNFRRTSRYKNAALSI